MFHTVVRVSPVVAAAAAAAVVQAVITETGIFSPGCLPKVFFKHSSFSMKQQ